MCPTGSVLHSKATGKPNLRSAFDVLDVDHDGKISSDDLRTSYGGFIGESGDDMIGTMMTVADVNKDGYVEYEEFEKVVESSRSGRNGISVMEDVFKVMDKDGDGKVGVEDLKSYLNWAGLLVDDDDVKAMIKLGRGDENGGVTFEACGASGALYFLIEALTGCGCIYSCFYRTKMRKQYMLPESPCGDCILHFCCEYCALCQEYRELKHRGFDMSIGWQANMENQNKGIAMAPGVQGGMIR